MAESDSGKVKGTDLVRKAGVATFAEFMKSRTGSIHAVAASFVKPERVVKIALSCVTRTPKLQECTMNSIFFSVLQAVELGLEPGGALGEAYLVPFKDQCQMIPGYQGLATLAFRSGFVKSIMSKEVYEGESFDFKFGLDQKLDHIPSDTPRDPNKITHAYCIIKLKDGGEIADVMTRQEIDRIRGRSRAGTSGPWVTDYAEMAKKTVLRRALKLCPKSVELSKALSADVAADTGDISMLEFDGEIIDGDTGEVVTEAKRTTGVDAAKEKMGIGKESEADKEIASRKCMECGTVVNQAQKIHSQGTCGKVLCAEHENAAMNAKAAKE